MQHLFGYAINTSSIDDAQYINMMIRPDVKHDIYIIYTKLLIN